MAITTGASWGYNFPPGATTSNTGVHYTGPWVRGGTVTVNFTANFDIPDHSKIRTILDDWDTTEKFFTENHADPLRLAVEREAAGHDLADAFATYFRGRLQNPHQSLDVRARWEHDRIMITATHLRGSNNTLSYSWVGDVHPIAGDVFATEVPERPELRQYSYAISLRELRHMKDIGPLLDVVTAALTWR